MQKTAEKIVIGPGLASANCHAEKIAVGGHKKHVPKHGCCRYARDLRPTNLKTQLPAEGSKTCQSAGIEDFLNACKIPEICQAVFKGLMDKAHFLIKRIGGFDNVKFPAGSIKMGNLENAVRQIVFPFIGQMPFCHSVPEWAKG